MPTTVITESMAGPLMRAARSTSSSSAPIASRPTATSPTRSAPTRSRCWRTRTACRSTSRRRCRRSISATADGDADSDRAAQRARDDALRLDAPRARRRQHLESGLRRDAAPLIAGIITEKGIIRPPYSGDAARAAFEAVRLMTVLGIETSCDETAAAVVAETGDPARPWRSRSNVDRVAGGDPSRVGRRRAGARVPPARA